MNESIRVVKIRLKDIIQKEAYIKVLENANKRINLLCCHVYQFLRLWILSLNNTKIPEIDENVIHMCFKVIAKGSKRGPKPKGKNLKYYNVFREFYDTMYKDLGYSERISG